MMILAKTTPGQNEYISTTLVWISFTAPPLRWIVVSPGILFIRTPPNERVWFRVGVFELGDAYVELRCLALRP